jgi:hypothetical protein
MKKILVYTINLEPPRLFMRDLFLLLLGDPVLMMVPKTTDLYFGASLLCGDDNVLQF